MAHLWSGRFAGDPDAELFAFGSSFRFDRRLFEDDVRGSLAWAAGLARAGVLSSDDARAIAAGLEEILEKGLNDRSFVSDTHGDEDIRQLRSPKGRDYAACGVPNCKEFQR